LIACDAWSKAPSAGLGVVSSCSGA
jgi:hypothetical protein